MKHLIQPNDETCGQTCVAMAVGLPVAEVISRFGGGRTTRTQLVEALQGCGVRVNRRATGRVPKRAICKIGYRTERGGSHWVLIWDGKVLDPLGPEILSFVGIRKGRKAVTKK